MSRLYLVVEGQAEERFMKDVVVPVLASQSIFLHPIVLRTSTKQKGGAANFERVRVHATRLLKQDEDSFVGTFLDLYALKNDFPEYDASQQIADVHKRVVFLQNAFHREIVKSSGCRAERFISHFSHMNLKDCCFLMSPLCQKSIPNGKHMRRICRQFESNSCRQNTLTTVSKRSLLRDLKRCSIQNTKR
jgi:hypothetical protein